MNKKQKNAIKKLIQSKDFVNWTMALRMISGNTSTHNAESMVIQYIINFHNYKHSYEFYDDILKWIVDNISNDRLLYQYRKNFKCKPGSGLREQLTSGNTVQHNGNLTVSQMTSYLSSIMTGRKQVSRKPVPTVINVSQAFADEFDKIIKDVKER